MNHRHVRYLLVGGGAASSWACQAIRALDHEGEMMLVGQEPTGPYVRSQLSREYLQRGSVGRETLFIQEPAWYAAHQIELHTSQPAARLDTGRQTVALASGLQVSFDKLLLATGATPNHLNVPGADLPNVYVLRGIADADRLHHALDTAKAQGQRHPRGRGRACIIGGGLLGLELATTLTQMELAVDLVEIGPHPWPTFAGEAIGRIASQSLEQHGVALHIPNQVTRLEGDGRVQRVVLLDQTLACDLVLCCIGSSPNRELLRSTPISAEKAILVDDHCRTNVADIYAAGDCAAIFDPLFGKHRLLDHMDNAVVTGTLAGTNMAGGDQAYRQVNWFSSNLFDLCVSVWGEARVVERRLLRRAAQGLVEIGVSKDGTIAQVVALGEPQRDTVYRELVARRLRIDGNEELLKDPQSRLGDLFA